MISYALLSAQLKENRMGLLDDIIIVLKIVDL